MLAEDLGDALHLRGRDHRTLARADPVLEGRAEQLHLPAERLHAGEAQGDFVLRILCAVDRRKRDRTEAFGLRLHVPREEGGRVRRAGALQEGAGLAAKVVGFIEREERAPGQVIEDGAVAFGFLHRGKVHPVERLRAPLRLHLEDAHRLDLIPEPLDADRGGHLRREDIQDAAADGELPPGADQIDPRVA